mmetsp:Transcript_30290/g.70695  ORF Transcript_30290/g.70695 Transcript_30290/m.70695 type:complete len:1129 (-) Transcript_30290:374-3760(-)
MIVLKLGCARSSSCCGCARRPLSAMQKAIRECHGKKLMGKYMKDEHGVPLFHCQAAHVKSLVDLETLPLTEPWLLTSKLVVKPDQLIKRRGKAGLVKIGLDWEGVKAQVREWMGMSVELEGVRGTLDTFIIEPMADMTDSAEHYICIYSLRDFDVVMFYHEGGVDVGDVDAKASKLEVKVGTQPDAAQLTAALLGGLPVAKQPKVASFVAALYRFYVELAFTYLEINPIVMVGTSVLPLDLAAKVDLTAQTDCADKWGHLDMPAPFGRKRLPEEEYVEALDEKTGASLKLTVLNPEGRVWTMVAGGGASVIYADTICDMGFAKELCNYGEYSGAPTKAHTFEYAKTILSLMCREPVDQPGYVPRGKVLIIGGGIANFTNVASTFGGIIQAFKVYAAQMIAHKVQVYVRRGGPNFQEGLDAMREAGRQLGIPCAVFGPETHLTAIVPMAFQYLDPAFKAKPTLQPSLKPSEPAMRSSSSSTALDKQPVLNGGGGPHVGNVPEVPGPHTLFTAKTRAVVYGLQTVAVQNMLDFDFCCRRETPSVAGMIYPFGGDHVQKFYWGTKEVLIPVFKSTENALAANLDVDVMVNFASQRSVYSSVMEALKYPQLRCIAIIAEGVPENKTRLINQLAKEKGVAIIGPATVGGIKPGCFRIGNTGGMIDNCIQCKLHRPGSVAYVSRSGGMSNELNNIVSMHTNGVYEGIAIGGDRYPGTTFVDHIMRYEANPNVKMIILLGEVGGVEEYVIADAIKSGAISKPLVAWCIGTCSKNFNHSISFGHAGSAANSNMETSEAKNEALKASGAVVPDSFNDLPEAIKVTYDKLLASGTVVEGPEPEAPRMPMDYKWASELGLVRKPAAFVSTICDDRGEELLYAGMPISKVFEEDIGIGGVLSLLWFKRRLPKYATKFIEMVLMLTADHGPAVAGAHNTIITARAGKDMVSSLVSGLLTIGPRFGGAVDGAAEAFSAAVDAGLSPSQLIESKRKEGELLMGIGHRVKSLESPDLRVSILKAYVMEHFPDATVLKFALEVEKLTTRKKSNLILNVDGTIGCAFVDLLRGSGAFTREEADEYIHGGVLNGLFVLGRSIGFIGHYLDQKRLKQSLYRHPWDDICYMLPQDQVESVCEPAYKPQQ